VRLISLQKGAPSQQIAAASFGNRIEVPDTDPDPAAGNFVDTAALMMKLDLVVCCDTSLVHLAGALGRPVFTAVPFVTDWRWLQDRKDTPWYPTMRLFRQTTPQDWSDVFAKIAAAAAELASAKQR
jgi:ADP-heptose:LPS heptosyltransferase